MSDDGRVLDPSEVSPILGADGQPVGYVWEPHKLDPAWLYNPLMLECMGCRHCRKGRMCKGRAEEFRKCVREQDRMLWAMRARIEELEQRV